MATADEYAQWIVNNADKRGTPEFNTVAAAYKEAVQQETPPPKEAGFIGAFKEAVSLPFRAGKEAAEYAASPTEEKRKALLEAGKSQYAPGVGFGEGENWEALKEMAGASLGAMFAPVAAATGVSAVATPIAGIGAGFATSASQYEIENLLRQAQEQERAAQEGKAVPELELSKSLLASAGQAGLDVAGAGVFAKALRRFPLLRNLVTPEKTSKEIEDALVDAFEKGTLKTTKAGVLQGVGKGVAFEVPQEIGQQMLERWQAGLSLTDDEAKDEYKQAAIGAILLGGPLGGVAGAVETRADVARAQELAAKRAEPEAAASTLEIPPEPVVEPTAEAAPEVAPEPVVEPTAEAAPEVAPEPVVEPIAEAAPEVAPEPVAEPTVEPAIEAPATPAETPDLRARALDLMRTTGRTGAPFLQAQLGIKLSEAKAIRDSFIADGTLKQEGKKVRLAEPTTQETSSAVPDTSVAETQPETAGARPAVPVLEPGTEVGSAQEAGGQGLADTGVRAAEPVGREGTVAGALTEEAAPVAPAAPKVAEPVVEAAAPVARKAVKPAAATSVQIAPDVQAVLNDLQLLKEQGTNAVKINRLAAPLREAVPAPEAIAAAKEYVAPRIEVARQLQAAESKPVKGGAKVRTQLAPAGAGVAKADAQKVVADLSQGWTNSPTINVVESIDELPESVRASATPESRGLYDPETRTVHVLAQNADSPESIKGTVFHESLGHFGLAEQFDDQLDGVMSGIYQTNTAARAAANEWLKANPTAYQDVTPEVRRARAVEEVLAARSEAGPIKEPGIRAAFNRAANFVRNVGRKMGLVKTYSDNDVNQILRQAHGRVYAAPRKVSKVKGVRLQAATNTPQGQFYAKALDSVMDTVDKLPEPTKQVVDRTLSVLSEMGAGAKKGWIALQSFYHLEDAYGKWLPIAPIVRYIEKRASETSKILAADEQTLAKYKQAVNKHPKLEQAWRTLFGEVTLYQIGPWETDSKKLVADVDNGTRTTTLSPYEKKQYEITKRFLALPKELQDTMQSIYADYEKRGEAAKQAAFRFLPPSVREAFEKRFEDTRLKYWAPLRRRGNYILTYLDKDGNYWSQRFESEYLRKRAIRDVQKLGATQINTSMNVREARTKGQLPAGFTADVLKAVEDSFPPNASADYKQQVLDNIYETYMDYVPSESLKQSTRGRTKFDVDGVTQIGVLGFDPDVLGTYEKYMAQSAYQMKNLEYAPLVDKAMTTLRDKVTELSSEPPQGVSSTDFADVLESIEGRVKFAANPTYANIVMLASKTNYVFSIAANVSTAIFNTTVLPTMAYSEMMAVHGPVKTYKAMITAMGMFVRSGRDATGNYTYATKATGEHAELFKALEERGVLGIAAEQELRQAQSIKVKGYESLSDKLGYYTSFMFRTTERFNREVVALSAFQLATDSGKSVDEAIQYAVDVNNRVNGPTLPELQSRLYQSNIGRIMLTFKTFVVNHMIHISRVFHAALKGESPEVRAQARKKLLGIYATTYMFAGIKGLPFFGAAEILANLLMGDDDEPYDVQQELLESVKTLGTDGPVAEMFNIATASRTGYADVLWRDDPKRLAEVGLPTFVLEKSLGPTWGLLLNYKRGFDEIGNGNLDRAMEAFTPAAARNVLKSLRYATEGVLDKNGNPIADDVSAYNTFMQAFGFAPQDLTVIQAQRGARYEIDKKLRERRTALLTQRHAAKIAGDWEALAEINEAMIKFNRANPSIRIGNDTLKRSDAQHKRQRELMEGGTYLPKKRAIAASKYVPLTEEEQEELED